MKKQIFCVLFSMALITPSVAKNIHIDGKVATQVILEHVDKEHQAAVLKEYNNQLKSSGDYTISTSGLFVICKKAGWNISNPQDKNALQKCDKFVKALVQQSDYTYDYYEVCDDDKGKSGGTERCIDDVFDDIEVQIAQAKNLAQEYARVKYNDDIVCSTKTRSGIDDYVKCASKKTKTYYEFKFDDTTESNAYDGQFVQSEFGRGLCLIYGGKPESVASKPLARMKTDWAIECEYNNCNALKGKFAKWGYEVGSKGSGTCSVSYKEKNTSNSSQNYYAKFDGKKLSVYRKNGSLIQSWPAVSGRGKSSTDPRPTICQLPKYQSCKDIGPIPSGRYYINQNEIQFADNVTIGNFNSNSPFANRDGASWGTARVILHPNSGTNMYGREPNMYIHGGKYAGSAGCIDLTTRIGDFMNWFISQTESPYLQIIVDYGSNIKVCTKTKQCDKNGNCSCECITDPTKCAYLN